MNLSLFFFFFFNSGRSEKKKPGRIIQTDEVI